MTTIKVDRRKWLRGGDNERQLFMYDDLAGRYDICAHLIRRYLQVHFSLGEASSLLYMKGRRFPSEVCEAIMGRRNRFEYELAWMVTTAHNDSDETLKLIELNDSSQITDSEREQKIQAHLASLGISATFHDVQESAKPTQRELKSVWVTAEFIDIERPNHAE